MNTLIKKTLKRKELDYLLDADYQSIYLNKESFKGTIALLTFKKLKEVIKVKDKIIMDVGYSWLEFIEEDKNYCLTALYDNFDNLLEIYIDISKDHNFKDKLNPSFIDLKLDILIKEDKIYLLDEDELLEALKDKLIDNNEYMFIKKEAATIIENYLNKSKKLYEFIDKYYWRLKDDTLHNC